MTTKYTDEMLDKLGLNDEDLLAFAAKHDCSHVSRAREARARLHAEMNDDYEMMLEMERNEKIKQEWK